MYKRLIGLVLALVLMVGSVPVSADGSLTVQEIVEQVIVPMALANDTEEAGYTRYFSYEELAEIVRVMEENGITLPETDPVMKYLTSGYGCPESLVTQDLGFEFFGEWGAWTMEQQAWYDTLEYKMGHTDILPVNVPGEDNMTPEEAVAYALKKLREEYGDDLSLEDRNTWRMHTSFFKRNEAQGTPEDCWNVSWVPNDLDHTRYTVIFNDHTPEERTEVYGDPLLPENKPLTPYDLQYAFSIVYNNQNKWPQKAWQKYHELLLEAKLNPSDYDYIDYVGYQLTSYPEPGAEDISREEAIRIAKEAMTNKRASYYSAVLTEYKDVRAWMVAFDVWVPLNIDEDIDDENGSYVVSVDSRTGEVRSLRTEGSYGLGFYYIAEEAYKEARDLLPKEEDLMPQAIEAVRVIYPEAGDPTDENNYRHYASLWGTPTVRFIALNLEHSNITVTFTTEGEFYSVDMEPPTDGDNLFQRYYNLYKPMSYWDQSVWVQLEQDMKDLEPKEIRGKILKATHYPEEDSVTIKHEEARRLGRKTTGKRFTEVNSCVLVGAEPHPVWIVQLLSDSVLSLAGIDAETGETVFNMTQRGDFSPQYMDYSLPETWRKIEMEEKGPAYVAQAAIIDRVFPADTDWRDCTVGDGVTWRDYREMGSGLNWQLEEDGLTVRYLGRRKGFKNYEVELDPDGNVIRFEETEDCVFAEESNLPVFTNYGEAEKYSVACSGSIGERNTTIVKINGKLYEVVAEADEKTLELLETYIRLWDKEGHSGAGFQAADKALTNQIKTLPVTEVIEITDAPMTRKEMDSFIGKTLKEVRKNDEGMDYTLIPDSLEESDEVVFSLYRNSFCYKVVVNESWEVFNEMNKEPLKVYGDLTEVRDYDTLTVKRIEYLYPWAH